MFGVSKQNYIIMKKLLKLSCLAMVTALAVSCSDDGLDGANGKDGLNGADGANGKDGKGIEKVVLTPLETSVTPVSLVKIGNDFSSTAKLEVIMSSQDILPSSPDFIYGSMADGAGLLKKDDGTYAFIQNLERDYSVARITLNSELKPVFGEYIMDAQASGHTNLCSATLVTPEEHGFGPLFITAAEWQGSNYGGFGLDPNRSTKNKGFAFKLDALGEWSAENIVPVGKEAYGKGTVAFIGDDDSHSAFPRAHFAMFVGYNQFGGQDSRKGNLQHGKRFALKFTDNTTDPFEAQVSEGETIDVEWTEIEALQYDEINDECIADNAIGFSRIEDIDYRKGIAANQREIYFCVTGRKKDGHLGKGTVLGRIYKLTLNETDPEGTAKLTCILDGDDKSSKAYTVGLHSPDNIMVTENYVYIQEDPNGYASDNVNIGTSAAKIYQYNIITGDIKVALECDQIYGAANDYGVGTDEKYWEIGGMIDVTDVIGASESTFLFATQNHGWNASNNPETAKRVDGEGFTDPKANSDLTNSTEASVLFKVTGLDR